MNKPDIADELLESMSTRMKWDLIMYTKHIAFHRGFWIGSLLTGLGIVLVAAIVENYVR